VSLRLSSLRDSNMLGKTAVLCRIIGYRLLPSGPDLITRHPLILELRYSASATPKFTFSVRGSTPVVSSDPNVIRNAVFAHQQKIKESGVGLSKEAATLRVESNHVVDIDCTDLPGLLSAVDKSKGEPDNMAALANEIATEYLQKPGSLALHIADASSNPRNSPSHALLQHFPAVACIHVLTKCDKHLDQDWEQETGKSSPLSEHFSRMPKDAVSLRNFADDDFEGMATRELKFFADNSSAEEKKQFPNVGIRALLQKVSQISESGSRPAWKAQQEEAEKKVLAGLQIQLAALGPPQSAAPIIAIVVEKLWGNGNTVLPWLESVFDRQGFTLSSNAWNALPTLVDPEKFASAVERDGLTDIKLLFAKQELKLARFEAFRDELLQLYGARIQNERSAFLQRWARCKDELDLLQDLAANFVPNAWRCAMVNCAARCFFRAMLSAPTSSLVTSWTEATSKFSTAECAAIAKERDLLTRRIQATNEVLALL
jgi:hypothetical protein